MLPSNSSQYPFSYSDLAFDFESNPTSKQESITCDDFSNSTPNMSFFHFPNSPFEDYQYSHDFLLEFQHQTDHLLLAEPEPVPQPIVNNNMEEIMGVSSIKKTEVPRKRDRHSKIKTARGLRDRRMRLSLQVAKRFFRLQDMLGFEKASKTVEWLLNQAKKEINQVAAAAKSSSASSSSELCEALSIPEEVVRKPPGVMRRTKHSRKISAFHHPLAKEYRKKARERARERTKEKMISKQCEAATTNHKLSQLGSWTSSMVFTSLNNTTGRLREATLN